MNRNNIKTRIILNIVALNVILKPSPPLYYINTIIIEVRNLNVSSLYSFKV
jgi:hypothetical protein